MGQKQASPRRARLRSLVEGLPAPLARNLLFIYAHRQLPRRRHPRTFNQKLNYRVLYDRRPLLTMASSKLQSKVYAESFELDGLKIPQTLWSGRNLADLDGKVLKVDWVIKPSHRSGLVRGGGPGAVDVSSLGIDPVAWLAEREYRLSKLWGYKNVRREFIVEQRISAESGEGYPDDIKFFVFDQTVRMIWVDSGRYTEHQTRTCYTPDWEILPYDLGAPRADRIPPPANLKVMIEIAEKLASEFDFVRVDLYQEGETVVFGELTAYPFGGLTPWSYEIDNHLGEVWSLPDRTQLGSPHPRLAILRSLRTWREP